jgi:hypothetical protein
LIVIIEDEVFALPSSLLDLLGIFQLGAQGRHWVQTEPLYPSPGSHLDRWIERLANDNLRDEVKLALEIGVEQDAGGLPSDLTIRITRGSEPHWSARPPRLPLVSALPFLQGPLRLLVENRRNDGAFLRAMAPVSVRKKFLEALEEGWIDIVHGGGSDMKTYVENASEKEAMRLWALSDSDAREPGSPSESQIALSQLCASQGIAHHLLQRRAIENYLPAKALDPWVYSGPRSTQSSRRDTLAAFARLRSEQRHHYNMKHGFNGDRPDIPSLFEDCAEHPRLQNGFGQNIAARFHAPLQEEWLRKDGQQLETLAMVQSILRRL